MRRSRALPEALLIGALGAFLLWTAFSGRLALYIHPRYQLAVGATGAALLAAAGGLLALPAFRVRRGLLIGPALVLALALLVPARPLGASLIPGKALGDGGSNALITRWQAERSEDTRDWTLLEWTAALRQLELAALRDKQASFEGFVYRTEGLAEDEVLVARYVVTCCTADGTALSLRVRAPGAAALRNDDWVRVEGVLGSTITDGKPAPLVIGTLTPIETPDTPYLYP